MNSKLVIFIFTIGVVLGTVWVIQPFTESSDSAQLITSGKPDGGNFTLQSVDGKKQLSDYSDKLVMIYFGYTFCPDVCPTNLSSLAAAYQSLTIEQQQKTQILFISVDPERDTVKRLQEYVNYFEADIVGLTDTPEVLSNLARQYGVVYAKVETEANNNRYAVDHSAYTYLIAPQGKLKQQLPHATTPQQFIDAMQPYVN